MANFLLSPFQLATFELVIFKKWTTCHIYPSSAVAKKLGFAVFPRQNMQILSAHVCVKFVKLAHFRDCECVKLPTMNTSAVTHTLTVFTCLV